jgi:hypothetical protein
LVRERAAFPLHRDSGNAAVTVTKNSTGRCCLPNLDAPGLSRSFEEQRIERKPPDGQAETDGTRVLRRLNQWNRIATMEDVLARERR